MDSLRDGLVGHVQHVPPNLGFPDQWEIVNGDGSAIAVRQSKAEAEAFADGYNIGVRHGGLRSLRRLRG